MIINSLIKQGSKILKKQNIDSHQIDAELLLSKAIRKDRVFLLTNDEYKVSQKETSDYLNFILRRKHHEPLSYIIKRKEFWSLGFNVNHNVLIPRPETETIVEQVVRRFKGKGSLNILDIGTGSGCILLSILKELTNSYGIGIDKSFKALNIAKKNSKKLNLLQRTKFIHCDVDNFNFSNYDVIVSNPPYLSTREINGVAVEIANEPRCAISGGLDGLKIIRRLFGQAPFMLRKGGRMLVEISPQQVSQGLCLARSAFPTASVRCVTDLQQMPRVIIIET